MTPYNPTRELIAQIAGLLVVPRLSKSTVGQMPSTIRPRVFVTSSQFKSRRRTQCPCLKIDLKPSLLKRLIIQVNTEMPSAALM